jgi:NADH-quinone oxidoreductase subunit L
LIPIIPAVAFVLIIFFGKKLPMKGSELGVLSMLTSLAFAGGAAWQWIQRVNSVVDGAHEAVAEGAHHVAPYVEPVIREWTWWQSGGFHFGIGQHIDGLALTLLVVVAFISSLVQIYSLEYLRGDRRYTHFFAALTLFSAGMLCMVLAPNMVQLILGWEIMGLCSFMLIGHWWEEEANSRAALKAFFTVRVGDMGLLIGTAICSSRPIVGLKKIWESLVSTSVAYRLGPCRARPVLVLSPGVQLLCSLPVLARAVSSRCIHGCPTPWPDRLQSVRCCTRAPWLWPVCS